MRRRLVRLAAAGFLVAGLVSYQPDPAEAVPMKWALCLVWCGEKAANECYPDHPDDPEYCAGYWAGCMTSCLLF